MKILILIIPVIFVLKTKSQDCSISSLFKKGTHLEFSTYSPVVESSKGKPGEITRLSFIVDDVRDSNSVRYSYITKTGINPVDENQHYQKKYVLKCDGVRISIPYDFYSTDTIYFTNKYPNEKRDKGYYTTSTFIGKTSFLSPLDFDKGKFEMSSNSVSVNMKVREYERQYNKSSNFTGQIMMMPFDTEMNIKKIEVKGKEMITTPAGNFECYKIAMTSEMKLAMRTVSSLTYYYYNQEFGIIKTEIGQGKSKETYMELRSAKSN